VALVLGRDGRREVSWSGSGGSIRVELPENTGAVPVVELSGVTASSVGR
jgi:hypothetical protein